MALVAVTAVLSSGCSLIAPSVRPVPGAQRNLFCALEYRPDVERPEGPDILFLAAGMPYRVEEVYMSLPDGLLHTVFAPGRHLTKPVHLRGVRCDPPVWGEGHRVPGVLKLDHGLLCRRRGSEPVEIEVETKWGTCGKEIPAGDRTPRCRIWFGRTSRDLESLSDTACPTLPEPTRASPRGRMPSGGFWVTVTEGGGPKARAGDRIRAHETIVTRSYLVSSSTRFDDEPRVLSLGEGEWPRWKEEGVVGMRVGERRRLVPPFPRDPAEVSTEDALFHYVELVAVLSRGLARGQATPGPLPGEVDEPDPG